MKKNIRVDQIREENPKVLPSQACILSHDFQLTKSKAGMQRFFQQNDPMYPIAFQYHFYDICQRKKDPQQIRWLEPHFDGNAQVLRENYMSGPSHLKQIQKNVSFCCKFSVNLLFFLAKERGRIKRVNMNSVMKIRYHQHRQYNLQKY